MQRRSNDELHLKDRETKSSTGNESGEMERGLGNGPQLGRRLALHLFLKNFISRLRDFFGRNDAKAETPVLWPPHENSWLIGKGSDAGRDWGQEEKGTTEDEMVGWHHWLDGRESEWTLGVGDGQGGLACCDSWGRKESDMTEQLNWTELNMDICLQEWIVNKILFVLLYFELHVLCKTHQSSWGMPSIKKLGEKALQTG